MPPIKLISWNVARRKGCEEQIEALGSEAPHLVALQEVERNAMPKVRAALERHCRLRFVEASFSPKRASALSNGHVAAALCRHFKQFWRGKPAATKKLAFFQHPAKGHKARRYGVVTASRWPSKTLAIPQEARPPWPERFLSVSVASPVGELELSTAHIPHGSGHGWIKVRTLEAIHRYLVRKPNQPRIFCGDLNTPQLETCDGITVTWGQRVDKRTKTLMLGRWRDSKRWHEAEWDILRGLAKFDLHDVFRRIHGYRVQDYSWWGRVKKDGKPVRRRFDHVFASTCFSPMSCRYLHLLRKKGLSDHSQSRHVFWYRGERPRSTIAARPLF